MISTVMPSNNLQAAGQSALTDVTGYLDDVLTVSLVEGSFDPRDPTTYPVASTKFSPIVGDSAPVTVVDAVSGNTFVMQPDPEGGWTFYSSGVTTPVTINGFVVKQGARFVGANIINAVVITGNGQSITLPQVSVQLPKAPYVAAISPCQV